MAVPKVAAERLDAHGQGTPWRPRVCLGDTCFEEPPRLSAYWWAERAVVVQLRYVNESVAPARFLRGG